MVKCLKRLNVFKSHTRDISNMSPDRAKEDDEMKEDNSRCWATTEKAIRCGGGRLMSETGLLFNTPV